MNSNCQLLPMNMNKFIQIITLTLLIFNTNVFAQKKNMFYNNQKGNRKSIEIPIGQTKKLNKLFFGRAAILINQKWGFVDSKDKLIIKPQFDLVYDFKTTVTAVMKSHKWYIIDRFGKKITNQEFDYVGPFIDNKAKVIRNNKFNFIDTAGKIQDQNWIPVSLNASRNFQNNNTNLNIGCPPNIDFDFGDFTRWTCDTGQVVGPTNSVNGVSTNGTNQIINSAITPPLTNKHTLINNSVVNGLDFYGGFPINSPDGSNSFIRLGSDLADGGLDPTFNQPFVGAKAESVFYDVSVPPNTTNLSFSYDFAVVLVEPIPVLQPDGITYDPPIHLFGDKPRFKVEIFDLSTNQTIPCGLAEFVADPSSAGAGGFLNSPLSNSQTTIWYKPWSKRFVNLAPYSGKNIRIKFSTIDCTLGAHWAYAYIDIQGCLNMATAIQSCSIPTKTVMDGPPGFQSYEWYTSNFSTRLGSGIHLVSNSNLLQVGDTVNVVITPAPLPFFTQTCSDTVKAIIQGPSLSFNAGPDQTICEGSRVSIGSSPIVNCTYTWRPNPSNLSSYNTSQVTASPTATTQYIIAVRDTSTNCYVEDTIKVFVKPKPNLNISISSLCYNINGNYGPIKLSGADIYSWTDTNAVSHLNIFNPNNDSATITNLTDTIVHYFITATNLSTGCKVDSSIDLMIYPKPIALFNAPSPACLKGNRFVFSSGSFINSGNNSTIALNSWIVNNGSPIFGPDIFYSFPAVGVFPVKLISVSDRGCIDSVSNTVEVYPMPKADFIPPTAQCLSGNSFTFDTLSTPPFGGSITGVKWLFGDNRIDTISPSTHAYITPGYYNVQLVVTSDQGCKDTTTKRIQVYPMPSAYFPLPDSKCLLNNFYQFSSQSTAVAPATIQSNIWDFGDGINGVSGPQVSHVYLNDGNIKVKLVSTSTDNCVDSVTQIFQIFPMPKADFTVPPVACFLNNNYLFTSSSSIITIQNPLVAGRIDSCFWNFGGTPRDTFGFSVRHQFTNPNQLSYPIRLICQTNNGCRDTTTKTINFLATPLVSIDPGVPLSICSGDSIRLHATANPVSGAITNYQWSVGGTNIPGATTPNITVSTSGIYQITVTNTDQCTNTSANDSVVVHPLPVGNVVLPNKDYICEFANMLLNCTSNASSYQWFLNGTSISGANTSSYLATQPGIYSVKLTSVFGCENFANGRINLNLRKKPIVDFSFPTFCKKEPILFNNLSNITNTGPINWLWNFGDNSISNQFNPTHTYMNEGNDTVTLTATSIDCPSLVSQSQQIITVAAPIPGLRYPTVTALKNNNTYLQARTFANSYLWSPSTGIDNPNISNPTYNYDQIVEYLIRLENPSGCMTVDTLLVRVYENADIQVPTGFSPNNDGHNDYLDMFLIGVKLKRFWVFNRWGQLLFETTDPKQKWDGTFKGNKQPAETYVWQAEITDNLGTNIIKRGQTILIR